MIIFIQIVFVMDDNFSPRVKDVITFSKEEALRLGHDFIGTEHLVLGIIRNGEGKAIDILNFLGIDLNELRRKVESLNLLILVLKQQQNILFRCKTLQLINRLRQHLLWLHQKTYLDH